MVLSIRNVGSKSLFRFFFGGLCFSCFTRTLAFYTECVNQSILDKLFCTCPTLKLRLFCASHRRFP